ncbi:hypothetical protein ACH4S9_30940 [Streptomyces sp. NPDC021225]
MRSFHSAIGRPYFFSIEGAMFTGGPQHTEADLDHYATAGVRAFLAAYR